MSEAIAGQMSQGERQLLMDTIRNMPVKPQVVVEVGTWLGGGSTLHILRALHENGVGHLWGVEAVEAIYHQMIINIRAAAPEAADRFTPLFGLSNQVLRQWLKALPAESNVDLAFLDGGDNPYEQIEEFKLLAPRIKVGGIVMAHDVKLRKGKWLFPYVSLLDNWEVRIFDLSEEGLFHARKIADQPSEASSKSAERKLRQMRWQPVELIGRFLPRRVSEAVLSLMPSRLSRFISQGRK